MGEEGARRTGERAGVGRGGLPWKRPDTTKEHWPKFAIVERHLGAWKIRMIDNESNLRAVPCLSLTR